ncbi:hypothetical protein HK101_010840, partial [Irineochytrium annulatum]
MMAGAAAHHQMLQNHQEGHVVASHIGLLSHESPSPPPTSELLMHLQQLHGINDNNSAHARRPSPANLPPFIVRSSSVTSGSSMDLPPFAELDQSQQQQRQHAQQSLSAAMMPFHPATASSNYSSDPMLMNMMMLMLDGSSEGPMETTSSADVSFKLSRSSSSSSASANDHRLTPLLIPNYHETESDNGSVMSQTSAPLMSEASAVSSGATRMSSERGSLSASLMTPTVTDGPGFADGFVPSMPAPTRRKRALTIPNSNVNTVIKAYMSSNALTPQSSAFPTLPGSPIIRLPIMPLAAAPRPTTDAPSTPEELFRKLDDDLTRINFDDVTVAELKEHLRVRGLPSSGKKALLVQRLQDEIRFAAARKDGSMNPDEDPRIPMYNHILQLHGLVTPTSDSP